MGNIGMMALRPLALKLRDKFDIHYFIETGTYKASTTAWAANNFEDVTTFEAYEPYYKATSEKHKGLKNIKWIYGSSGEKLLDELPEEPALVWLDAHWCGNYEMSEGTSGECPLVDELDALNVSPVNHFVMIDDARLFIDPPPRPHDPAQWPRFEEVVKLLKVRHPKRVFVYEDAIIAVPPEAAHIVREMTGTPGSIKVIMLTSNDYLRCIQPFAYLFNKYWSKSQPVTVVRYDKRPRGLPPNFSNFAVGVQSDYTWSSGLAKYLNYLSEDLLILLLEDYFIDHSVNVKRIEGLWAYMEQHPEIAKIDLSGDRLKFPHEPYHNGLVKSENDAHFQSSLQAAIWRKDFLIQFLEPSESPWQFEKKGTKRIMSARESGEFDGLILGANPAPLHYVNAVGGEGNKPGQYDFKKFSKSMLAELNGARLL